MQLSITGKQIDIGNSLRGYVQSKVLQTVSRHFENAVDGSVTFSRDGYEYRADCSVHLASGLHLHAQGRSTDIYASFDIAIERMGKRVQRYKGRLRDQHGGAKAAFDVSPAHERVIQGHETGDENEVKTLTPVVVSESPTSLRTMSVGEAVMQLDLTDTPAFIFRNGANGEVNVIYRRSDGNIGWIDPQSATAKS